MLISAFVGAMVGLERAVHPLLAGAIADLLGMDWAISAMAALTLLAGLVAARTMTETLQPRQVGRTSSTVSKPRPSLLD